VFSLVVLTYNSAGLSYTGAAPVPIAESYYSSVRPGYMRAAMGAGAQVHEHHDVEDPAETAKTMVASVICFASGRRSPRLKTCDLIQVPGEAKRVRSEFQISPPLTRRRNSSASFFTFSVIFGSLRFSKTISCMVMSAASFGLKPRRTSFLARASKF
jgi:hypothetical protein